MSQKPNFNENNNLLNIAHLRHCSNQLLLNGLPQHHDPYKDWDLWMLYQFLSRIKADLPNKPSIYDMGCGKKYAATKFCAHLYSENATFFASDLLSVDFSSFQNSVNFFKGKVEESGFADASVDVAISLSVIEHGVDLEQFAKELNRVLNKGGKFFITTDYWPEEINTKGLFPYGLNAPEMMIFSNDTIAKFIEILGFNGLCVINKNQKLNLVEDPVVYWSRMDKRYTFTHICGFKL